MAAIKQEKLKTVYWNAAGLRIKKHEVMAFLQKENIDIMLIGETWLKANISFKIPNYAIYRTDRILQPQGGTAILIKKHIPHVFLQTRQCQIENTIIEVNTKKGPLKIIAGYCSPNRDITQQDLETLFTPNDRIILLADLNAKNKNWGCNTTNPSGRNLLNFFQSKNIELLIPTTPTHYHPTGRPEILDIGIAQNIGEDLGLSVLQDLSSDHNPISIEISTANNPSEETIKRIVQWPKFTNWLKNNTTRINLLYTEEDINKEIDNLTGEISTALQHSTKEITLKGYQPTVLPVEIRQLIKEKRQARKRAQRTLDPEDARTASRLNNQLREALKEYHEEQWNHKLETLNSDKNGMWKLIKSMKTTKQQIPPLQGPNGTAYTREEKAETLADSIQAQCSPNAHLGTAELENLANQNVRLLNQQPSDPVRHASLEELESIIKRLKMRKSPGLDGVSNKAVKAIPKKCKVKLLNILNACLRLNYFPTNWKTAIIITIPKPGKDHSLPENHRPISLLSTLSKILERLILKRLNDELENRNIIPQEQFGFRSSHSCELQTLRLSEIIASGMDWKHTTAIAYLDISKAFDRVWHQGLIHKMKQIGLPTGLVKIVHSILENRKFKVRQDGHESSTKTIQAGVPQGSVLGPILYNIYTHDIPEDGTTFKALYADDTALGTQSRNTKLAISKLQRTTDNVIDWMSKWKVAVNEGKTQAVCFNRKLSLPNPRLEIGGRQIEWSISAKYLGLTFDRKLNWKLQTDILKKTGTIALVQLYPILKSDRMSLKLKLQIYTTIIRPAVTYSIATWGCAAVTNVNKIQVIQNKALRMITGAPWFVSNLQLHKDLKIPSIRRYMKAKTIKTLLKAENHENHLIRQAVQYNIQDCRVFTRRPRLIPTLDNGPY